MKQIIIEKTLHGMFYENGNYLLLPICKDLVVFHKKLGCIAKTENTKEQQLLYIKAILWAVKNNSIEVFFKINEYETKKR